MTGPKTIALAAALAATSLSAQTAALAAGFPVAADSVTLANALTGPALDLTMRGTTVTVMATASVVQEGCALLMTAHAPGSDRRWSRLYRWSDVAWSGSTPDGRTKVAFYDHEARMPVDMVTFRPIDPTAFTAAVERASLACRSAHGEGDRIAVNPAVADPSCIFPRHPGLQLVPASRASDRQAPPRAMLTILARENPEAELQLLFERAAHDSPVATAFTFADPRLRDMRIAAADFALDGTPVIARHSLATFGDTRVRITLDPDLQAAGREGASFDRKLAASGEMALVLLDSARRPKAKLHFRATAAMAAARRALETIDWSCEGASPAPGPASEWKPAA